MQTFALTPGRINKFKGQILAHAGKVGQVRGNGHVLRAIAHALHFRPVTRIAELRRVARAVRVAWTSSA